MNKTLLTLLCAAACVGSAQAADVGVSIAISQPGVYGRIDIGQFPQPAVMVSQPISLGGSIAGRSASLAEARGGSAVAPAVGMLGTYAAQS